MFDIITKENEVAFNEKIELDDEVSVVNSPKNLSDFEIARARKARGDRRRKAAERHRGQRDGKRHPKRDENPENLGVRFFSLRVDNIESVNNEFDCGPVMEDWFGKKYCFTTDPDGLPIEFHE